MSQHSSVISTSRYTLGYLVASCIFFSEPFEILRSFLSKLDDNTAALNDCKTLIFKKNNLQLQLQFIEFNFKEIPKTIKLLETQGLKMANALEKFESLLTI